GDQELLVAQHVQQRVAADDGAVKVRALGHGRTHKQAPVASAFDGQPRRIGVMVLDEPFSGGKEIVEDVLLLLPHAGVVPLLAKLPATAKVGQRKYTAVLRPDYRFR